MTNSLGLKTLSILENHFEKFRSGALRSRCLLKEHAAAKKRLREFLGSLSLQEQEHGEDPAEHGDEHKRSYDLGYRHGQRKPDEPDDSGAEDKDAYAQGFAMGKHASGVTRHAVVGGDREESQRAAHSILGHHYDHLLKVAGPRIMMNVRGYKSEVPDYGPDTPTDAIAAFATQKLKSRDTGEEHTPLERAIKKHHRDVEAGVSSPADLRDALVRELNSYTSKSNSDYARYKRQEAGKEDVGFRGPEDDAGGEGPSVIDLTPAGGEEVSGAGRKVMGAKRGAERVEFDEIGDALKTVADRYHKDQWSKAPSDGAYRNPNLYLKTYIDKYHEKLGELIDTEGPKKGESLEELNDRLKRSAAKAAQGPSLREMFTASNQHKPEEVEKYSTEPAHRTWGSNLAKGFFERAEQEKEFQDLALRAARASGREESISIDLATIVEAVKLVLTTSNVDVDIAEDAGGIMVVRNVGEVLESVKRSLAAAWLIEHFMPREN